jgi:hypothetical protein
MIAVISSLTTAYAGAVPLTSSDSDPTCPELMVTVRRGADGAEPVVQSNVATAKPAAA